MNFFIAIVILCFATPAYSGPIIGGNDAPDGKYPYKVSLRFNSLHFCSGSILNKRWILTAAHCIKGYEDTPLEVVTNLLEGDKKQVYESEYVVTHEKHDDHTRNNDIGMIRVNRDIEFNDNVQPITLPKTNIYGDDDPTKLIGWNQAKHNYGGPLVTDSVQVGINSFVDSCTKCKPDNFTHVYTFLDWIAAQQAKF